MMKMRCNECGHVGADFVRSPERAGTREQETFNECPKCHSYDSTLMATRDANFWREECNFCNRAADSKGKLRAFNFDTACFVRYLEMQRNTATRDGFHDSAQYLQHIIDDAQRLEAKARLWWRNFLRR